MTPYLLGQNLNPTRSDSVPGREVGSVWRLVTTVHYPRHAPIPSFLYLLSEGTCGACGKGASGYVGLRKLALL